MHCERMKHQKARKYGHRHWHKEGNSAGKLGAKTMSKQILHMYSINVSCCSIYSIMGVELDKVANKLWLIFIAFSVAGLLKFTQVTMDIAPPSSMVYTADVWHM